MLTAIIAAASAVFTVSGYVNNASGIANIQYDQQVVQESLKVMAENQQQLLEKAKQETDPAKRQQKLLVAQKLGQTHQDLSQLQSELVVKATRKEAAGIVKNLLSTGGGAAVKVSKLAKEAVGLYDAGLDTAVNLKATLSESKIDDTTVWSDIARSSEGIDVAIEKVKARQQLKETQDLNDELSAWVKDLQAQEKAGQIDSDQFEQELGHKIEQEPELRHNVLDALNTSLDGEREEEKEELAPQTYTRGQNKRGSIVGYWLGSNPSDEWTMQFKEDGAIRYQSGGTTKYFMGDDGVGYWIDESTGQMLCLYYYNDTEEILKYSGGELPELVRQSIYATDNWEKECQTKEAENTMAFPRTRVQP
ncbi:MAG: hypothetical protein GF390_00650 [Candidatus Pacebacteria bacterium]|nr:hypothetical protein [Candidatus Paceibacterota bacterium]